MLKRLFSHQEIHIDRGSKVAVSAHRQSPCQRVANAKIVQLGSALDRRVSYARRDEAKHLFQVHKVHMATRDLSIRQVHGGPRVHPHASSTAVVIAPSRAPFTAEAYASIARRAMFDTP